MFRFLREAWTSHRTIRNPKPKTQPSARTRLSLDQFEDRVTPATLVVTTLQDIVANDGLLSLREAIQAANTNTAVNEAAAGSADGDIITFNIAGNNGAGGTINLTSELTITDDVTIDGTDLSGAAGAAITINAAANSRIVTINASGSSGTADAVTLRDLSLQNGSVSDDGGAIAIDTNESVTLDRVTLKNNTANSGGAISSENSELVISNSTITNNYAFSDNGSNTNGGGGIRIHQGTLKVTDTNFDLNRIERGSGGAAILNAGGTATLTGGSISNNNVDSHGGRGRGTIENIDGMLNIIGVAVNNNESSLGGAIHNAGSGSIDITGGTLNGNSATTGGAIWNSATGTVIANGVIIDRNNAAQSGGGIFNAGGTLTLVNSQVTNNITFGGGGINSQAGILTIQGGVIAGNQATSGGGMYLSGGATTLSNNVLIASNIGRHDGGGVSINGPATFVMTGGTIGGSAADGWNGNSTENTGGGIFMNAGSVSLTEVTVGTNNNSVDEGNVAYLGAGVCIEGGTLTITTSSISGNSATWFGGGIDVNGGSTTIAKSTFAHNYAEREGGALMGETGSLSLNSSTISDNTSKYRGGGVSMMSATIDIVSSTIAFNTVGISGQAGEGGGIFAGQSLSLRNTIVANNQALPSGQGPDIFGSFNSFGYNLIQNDANFAVTGDTSTNINGVDPLLGPLANNGGPTLTHALLNNSPTINVGDPSITGTDQTGKARPVDGMTDIGAFEFVPDTEAPAAPALSLQNDTGIAGDKITMDGSLSISGVEQGATVEYSIDNGANWTSSFTATAGSNSVRARQIDTAGNPSDASAALIFTLDKTPAFGSSLTSPSPNPRSTPVASLDVVFSEPINLGTFDFADLVLQRNGNNVVLNGSNATIAATADPKTYRVQLLPSLTASNGAYMLRVVAAGISDLAGNASTTDVQTTWSTTVNAVPGVPAITSPSGAMNDATPTITWTAANYAARYDLWIDSLTTGASQIIRQTNVQGTSFTPGVNLPFGSYRVWVRSVSDAGIFSAWSAAADFRTITPAITGPTGNASSATPTITWTAIDGAAKYDLWVDNLTSGASQVMRRTDLTTNSAMPANALPSGNYRAWVRAIDAAGNSTPWSAGGDFSVGIISVTGPTGTASSTPTINWSANSDAARYDLWVDNLTTGASQVVRQTNVVTNSYAVPTPLASGQYRVWVRYFNANGTGSPWSKAFDFVVGIPTVIAPSGTVLTATPTINWTSVSNAVRYDLWVDNRTTGQSQAIRQTNLSGTSFTPSTPLTSGSSYRIWVRAFNAQNIATAWSPFADFTIGNIV